MIAHKVLGDTLPVLAHELVFRITRVVGVHAASLHTLISSIRTVIVSITLPALRHTHMGAWTLESLRTAGFGFAFLVLIRTIAAVVGAVTHPVAGNAAMVPAFKLGECTKLVTVCLISPVLTVILFITGPTHRNAPTAGASKEVDWTFKLPLIWTVSLIRKVTTVIVAVTHPQGQVTQSGFLTVLERGSFNSKPEKTGAIGGLAVHFIARILAVDHLVTAAVVGDAASIFALELSCFAKCHVAGQFI